MISPERTSRYYYLRIRIISTDAVVCRSENRDRPRTRLGKRCPRTEFESLRDVCLKGPATCGRHPFSPRSVPDPTGYSYNTMCSNAP